MRNRIELKFDELKAKGSKALVTFITAGDPDLKSSEILFETLAKSGADLIELGIPFSDPSADGPTIQRASERALKHKVHLDDVLGMVRNFRKKYDTPVILMGYFNPLLQYGLQNFCKVAAKAGVDGLIVVDLPPEEADELHVPAQQNGIHLVYLLTPTANEERIQKVKSRAGGFVYFVSVTGVTGAATANFELLQKQVSKISKKIDLPLCIGFGINDEKTAKMFSTLADGVVVGSALVSIVEKKQDSVNLAAQQLGAKVSLLKAAIT